MSCWADEPVDELTATVAAFGLDEEKAIDLRALLVDDEEKVEPPKKSLDDLRSLLRKGKDDAVVTPDKSPEKIEKRPVEDLRTLIEKPDLGDTSDTVRASQQPASPTKETRVEEIAITADLRALLSHPEEPATTTADTIYSSVCTFESLNLSSELLKGVYAMGFTTPSSIQARALPLLLAKPAKNLIAQSQAGTGKTAAFVLAMLTRVDSTVDAVQAVCLAPTRELARQIMDNVIEMGKYTQVTHAFAIRDSVERGKQVTEHIVVGTPGTVNELIKRRQIVTRHVKIFVLDEADNMVDLQGLGDQSIRIKQTMPKDCQIVLFSATFGEHVKVYSDGFCPNANTLTVKVKDLSVDGIKQFYMDCNSTPHKVEVLQAIYGLLTIGQSIIFVAKRDTADMLRDKMHETGHTVESLHGKHDSATRDAIIDDFRLGKFKVLITTNVISRGIDVLSVNVVLNYDMPVGMDGRADCETYLHRIGRTGRFGRVGISICFVGSQEEKRVLESVEKYFGREIVRVPTDDYMEVERILKKAVK